MNGLKKAILKRFKLNECGGGYGGGCGGGYSSSSGSSYSGPRRSAVPRRSTVKHWTVELYNDATSVGYDISQLIQACRNNGKQIPSELKAKLDSLRKAAEEYVNLVDMYTGD